jgi:protein SCO1/2
LRRSVRIGLYVLAAALFAAPLVAVVAPLVAHPGRRAPDFTLTDQNGRPFTLSAERGSAVVLFFGYTNCPDVCPATLGAIASAYRKMGEPGNVRVVFVTVDPERDTPQALKRYIGLFDPRFIALTGSAGALSAVEKAYGVYAKIDPEASGALGYSVTHTAAVYVIDKDGNLGVPLDWKASAPEFAAAFRKALS